jgi:hypothetical protein
MPTTPTYRNESCSRCGGTGYYCRGVCFLCGGSKVNARQIRTDADGVAAREARRARAAAKREAANLAALQAAQARVDKFRESYPTLTSWLASITALVEDSERRQYHPILRDLADKAQRAPLSERQIELANKLLTEHNERAAKLATVAPWAAGRQVVEGRIVSSKWKESDYGRTNKLVVETAEGRRIYVTAPSPIWVSENEPNVLGEQGHEHGRCAIGDRLRFTVKVEPTTDDPTFAFGSRPTKGEIL